MRILLLVFLAGCSAAHSVALDAASADAGRTVPDVARADASRAAPHWEPTADAVGCMDHTATLLAGGDVLVVGDCAVDGVSATGFRYDADARTARPVDLLETRRGHAVVALDDGSALVIGGFSAADEALRTTEIFNAARDVFASGPELLEARARHAALRLGSRVVVVGGSRAPDDQSARLASVESIDLVDGVVSALPPLSVVRERMILLERAGVILAVGGIADDGGNGSVEVLGTHALEALPVWCPSPRAAASGLDVVCNSLVLDLSVGVRPAATLLHSHMEPATARLSDGSLFVIGSSPWTNDPPAFPERVTAGAASDLPSPGRTYLWPTATTLLDDTVLVIGEGGAQIFVP